MKKKELRRRRFKLHWGGGWITDEARSQMLYHEPSIQLLSFDSGERSLRRESGVGWVESFGGAQDRLRDTHRSPRWVSALCASTHPTISLEVRLLRYPAACCEVVHFCELVKYKP